MSESQKKQTFLHGAALLAIATAVVKLIGAFYKLPLKMVIGDQGYGYFATAYDIYSVLLLISTAGLPVAMSRMISQANATKSSNQVRRVFKTARAIFLLLGIGSALFMVLGSNWLATKVLMQPNAAPAIACLGPSALFMGIIATFRGFFQGHGNMRPTSRSQILEAAIKLLVGLGLAVWVMYQFKSVPLAAAGAITGVTVSCVISAIFLYSKFRPAYKELPPSQDEALSFAATAKGLLAVAIPITIGSAGLQFLTVVEQRLYMGQLLSGGISQDMADTLKGIYSMSITIYNMPCAFISPITISVLPAITAALTVSDSKAVRDTEESAARVTSLISFPCSVGLFILARPVMSLLGGYDGWKLDLAANLMRLLAICIFLQSVIQYSNAVMQAHGYAHIPVINMLSTGICKLAVVYILVGNPNIGIVGAPIGSVLCYTAIAILNLLAISRVVPQKPRLLRNLLRSLLPALVMGAAVFLCSSLLSVMHVTSRVILCGAPIAVGGVVYLLCAILFKSVTAEDCKLLPKGDKIAKLLKL